MTTRELIEACSTQSGLPFLIIGGHAVIAHGYARTTVDLDLLVCQTDREAWLKWFASVSYKPFHQHDAFAQMQSSNGGIDVDLMFVKPATFAQMAAAAQPFDFSGIQVRVPSLEHVIALKLHVLKQNLPHRVLGDLDDVINLVAANRLNLREDKWREVFNKYGTPKLYAKVLHATTP
jgi:hypothetical protein